MTTRTRFVVALCALSISFFSCSEGEAKCEDGLKAAARTHSDAVFLRNVDVAYSGLTKECRARISKGGYREMLDLAEAVFATAIGVPMNQVRFVGVDVRNFTDAEPQARVIYDAGSKRFGGGSNDWEKWVYQDGRWRPVECPV